jgi:chaperonin GroEL
MRKAVFIPVSMLKTVIFNFNSFKEKICDMVESGVVDSFAVIKTILQDSVSLAGMLITTECLVVKDKSYERNNITIH